MLSRAVQDLANLNKQKVKNTQTLQVNVVESAWECPTPSKRKRSESIPEGAACLRGS
jgi:hypothetical protein